MVSEGHAGGRHLGDLVRVKIKLVVLGQRMIIDVHLGPQMGKKGLDSARS